jgi:hypothetical protein
MKLKKIFSAMMAAVMLFAVVTAAIVSAAAVDSSAEDNDFSVYLLTEEIPSEITQYARETFNGFDDFMFEFAGFEESEFSSLRLAPGFTFQELTECDFKGYYFPIVNDHSALNMLMVIDDENTELRYQIGSGELASSLNTLITSVNNPAKPVITEKGMFAVYKNSNAVVMDISWVFPADSVNGNTANTTSTESNISDIYPDNTITEEDLEQLSVVEISEDTVYNKKEEISQTRAWVGLFCNIIVRWVWHLLCGNGGIDYA